MHAIQYCLVFIVLTFSPIPFASTSPTWRLAWAIMIGTVSGLYIFLKHNNHRLPKEVLLASIIFISLLAVWAAQIIVGLHKNTPYQGFNIVLYFLSHYALFLAVFFQFKSYKNRKHLINMIATIVCLHGMFGLASFELASNQILWMPKWSTPDALSGTFVNRNHYAAFIGLGVQCLITSVFLSSEIFREKLTGIKIASIFLLLLVVLLTKSRAGIMTVMFCSAILVIFSMKNTLPSWDSNIKALKVSFAILVISLAMALSSEGVKSRLYFDAGATQRIELYSNTLEAIKQNWFWGYGLGSFENVFRIFRSENIFLFFRASHNDYLELALAVGLPSAAIFFSGVWVLLAYLRKRYKTATSTKRPIILLGATASLQLIIHSAIDFPLQNPAVSYTFTIILAAALSSAATQNSHSKIV